ncbi:hypothetical protein ACJX0J_036720, partial [Zea mays]
MLHYEGNFVFFSMTPANIEQMEESTFIYLFMRWFKIETRAQDIITTWLQICTTHLLQALHSENIDIRFFFWNSGILDLWMEIKCGLVHLAAGLLGVSKLAVSIQLSAVLEGWIL